MKRKIKWRWWGVCGGILVMAGVIFWQLKSSVWDGKHRMVVVVASPQVRVFAYDPQARIILWWWLPDNLEIEVAGGYGTYPARALVGLDEQEKRNGNLVRDSVSNYLGVFTEGFGVVQLKSVKAEQQMARSAFFALFRNRLIRKDVYTNLSLFDTWRLWRVVQTSREDQFVVMDLSQTKVLNKAILPDGSWSYQTDMVRLTDLVQRWMVDESLVQEGTAVLVVNTTNASGLGAGLGRVLTTVGIHVVGVEDDDQRLPTSEIKVSRKDLRRRYSVRYLEGILGVEAQVAAFSDRAEVVVLLGEDYRVKLRGN